MSKPSFLRDIRHSLTRCFYYLLIFLALAGGCATPAGPARNQIPVGPIVTPLDNPDLSGDSSRDYLGNLNFVPKEAQHFDLINQALPLGDQELALLAQNGFVLSARSQWPRFSAAYAWIYWKDLPVLVTTDSILQAVHQSYSDLLMSIEQSILIPQITTILTATRTEVKSAANANTQAELAMGYQEVDRYLAVALALLEGTDGDSEGDQAWVSLANAADSVSTMTLFGSSHQVDFTSFEPRGHYTLSIELERYFRAMSWLAQIDFRLVEYDPVSSQPMLNREAIADVAILSTALDQAGQRPAWLSFNNLFDLLVGRSDNMTLLDFDHFMADLGLQEPAALSTVAPEILLNQLTHNDYGQQRITGQIITRNIDNSSDQPIPRPVTFALLGQRFSIDSYVLGNVVYDRLLVDGKPVERALPSPLDAMYALGNDRAVSHLSAELETYKYAGQLAALRKQVDGLDGSYWDTSVYNGWLGMIRSLNDPTLDLQYPKALRTAAWADKTLQTQLASWAQLRHDNILYAKQSYTTFQALCEYPAGYVEPYPSFFAALANYAQSGQAALSQIDATSQTESGQWVRQHVIEYFGTVQVIAQRLQILAEKELRNEAFTDEENAFLKSIIKRQERANFAGCAGPSFEDLWDGWYLRLFFYQDDNSAVIADVHTNPNDDPESGLYPPRVLHAATGPAAPLFLLVDSDEGTALYVGPAYTYFETVEVGEPLKRLTDEEWRDRLEAADYPQGSARTSSFRLPSALPPQPLLMGDEATGAQPASAPGTGDEGSSSPPAPQSPLTFP